jgi:hypothetical protein
MATPGSSYPGCCRRGRARSSSSSPRLPVFEESDSGGGAVLNGVDEEPTIKGRPVVSTGLGNLVLASGADRLILFGVKPDTGPAMKSELRTVAGSQQIGMVFDKSLSIEGRRVWRGDAVALPSRGEPGVDGLLPLRVFKAVYVCNSEGYVVFE